ncbi:MAG: class I SAM-dependent methyltransferase [Desulfobacterales bacterium]|nr:class I SAM-dependent methyltransferase [Desulfobacterales bacterium]
MRAATPCSLHITATASSPRTSTNAPSRFTRFNAMTNGIEHIECRTGDLFRPVQGHAFDLIVTNPPFVIFSGTGRHLPGLRVGCRRSVQDHRPGSGPLPRRRRLRPNPVQLGRVCRQVTGMQAWKAGSPAPGAMRSGHAVRTPRHPPHPCAPPGSARTEKGDAVNYPERFGEWLRHYDHLGISHIGAGVITMRKVRLAQLVQGRRGPGRHARPLRRRHCKRIPAPGLPRRRHGPRSPRRTPSPFSPGCPAGAFMLPFPRRDGWRRQLKLRPARGSAHSGDIDPFMAGVLTLCSGQRSPGEVLQDLAAALDSSPDTIQDAFIGICIRALVGQGFPLA